MYETTSKHSVSCTTSVQYAIAGKTLMVEKTFPQLLGRRLASSQHATPDTKDTTSFRRSNGSGSAERENIESHGCRLHWAEGPPAFFGPSAWMIGSRPLRQAGGVPDVNAPGSKQAKGRQYIWAPLTCQTSSPAEAAMMPTGQRRRPRL